jgi:hypothetical protein
MLLKLGSIFFFFENQPKRNRSRSVGQSFACLCFFFSFINPLNTDVAATVRRRVSDGFCFGICFGICFECFGRFVFRTVSVTSTPGYTTGPVFFGGGTPDFRSICAPTILFSAASHFLIGRRFRAGAAEAAGFIAAPRCWVFRLHVSLV